MLRAVAFVRIGALIWFTACPSLAHCEFRSFDGTGNNLQHPEWGAEGAPFGRIAAPDYDDGASSPRLGGLPNPRSRRRRGHAAA